MSSTKTWTASTPGRYNASWQNRQGPGDARPTAIRIIEDENLANGGLKGKIAVVTGTAGGIGVETVRALHVAGATVFATARSLEKLQPVVDEILKSNPVEGAEIIPVAFDQGSLEEVRRGAKEILEKSGGKVNILINNAGIMASPEGKTKEGFETQFGVNHLSHFLLFQLLKPALLAASTPQFNSRVVSVASWGHRMGSVRFDDYNFEKEAYNPWAAYGQSKTANIWFAWEISRRYGAQGLWGIPLHPGGMDSGLTRHVDGGNDVFKANPDAAKYMKSLEQGAANQIYAAVSKDYEGKGAHWLSNMEEWNEYGTDSDADIPVGGGFAVGDDGWAPHIHAEGEPQRLWKDSLKFVGVEGDA